MQPRGWTEREGPGGRRRQHPPGPFVISPRSQPSSGLEVAIPLAEIVGVVRTLAPIIEPDARPDEIEHLVGLAGAVVAGVGIEVVPLEVSIRRIHQFDAILVVRGDDHVVPRAEVVGTREVHVVGPVAEDVVRRTAPGPAQRDGVPLRVGHGVLAILDVLFQVVGAEADVVAGDDDLGRSVRLDPIQAVIGDDVRREIRDSANDRLVAADGDIRAIEDVDPVQQVSEGVPIGIDGLQAGRIGTDVVAFDDVPGARSRIEDLDPAPRVGGDDVARGGVPGPAARDEDRASDRIPVGPLVDEDAISSIADRVAALASRPM